MADIQTQKKQKEYEKYVKKVTPVHSLPLNMARAFLVGGLICVLGQWIMNVCQNMGMDRQLAGAWTSGTLILLSVLLTGLNIDSSNSVAASAIEFQKEGQVMGIGCKIFTIAGPVILFGIISSWILGVGYWLLKMVGVV